ncbi:hypothetical protein [Streptomyces sp. ODS28]|uniref:hypothetical protein n=1 Tax=Streptomyces sp. ODS28 TaxID=3136688 RepID=UPI0031E82DA0
MHMNSAPHLLLEDRPEFERVLDEALRTAHRRSDLAAIGQRLNTEQLRTMALSAATAICACAAAEYDRFVRLRDETRRPVPLPDPGGGDGHAPPVAVGPAEASLAGPSEGAEAGGEGRGGVGGLAGAMGEGLAEAGGAGLLAIVSVLAPVLAGTAAAIFLTLGYLLHIMTPEPTVAAPMRSIGWVFALLALAGVVLGMFALLITAVRNGASSIRAPRGADDDAAAEGPADAVDEARAAWREALLERGILPFLREALADPKGPGQAPVAYVPPQPEPDEEVQRTPRLGYSHPDFSSHPSSEPGPAHDGARPRFSSPDYSSPDYGGPEH